MEAMFWVRVENVCFNQELVVKESNKVGEQLVIAMNFVDEGLLD